MDLVPSNQVSDPGWSHDGGESPAIVVASNGTSKVCHCPAGTPLS